MRQLPVALGALCSYPQFVIYKKVPSESRPGKTDKFPIDSATGIRHNAHDPSIWIDSQTAITVAANWKEPYGVGFVLTENDPFWCVDIDNCLTPAGWAPHAVQVCQLLSGCAMEISQSGTGIHLFGCGKPPLHGCKNESLNMEFYHSGRFIALTGINATGQAERDFSTVLPSLVATYFPADPNAGVWGDWRQEWTVRCAEGTDAAWSGPEDDSELIRRAMASRSSAQAFGNKASFADLWLADESVLSRCYPDPARGYDASSADAALAQHLAFWTGKNADRMLRLMWESKLVREKWEREDYLPRTICGVIARQVDVLTEKYHLDAAKRRKEQTEENMRIGGGSEVLPPAGTLTEAEMLERYAYIVSGRQVIDLSAPQYIVGLEEWKGAHKASRTAVPLDGIYNPDGIQKTKSYETSRLWEMNPNRLQVHTVTFRPGAQLMTRDPNDMASVNTWKSIERAATVGDASLFLHHVDYLFGADAPRFLDWLAHIEQQPGELPHTGWVHISPLQGTGRNWLAGILCRLWRGYVASPFDLSGMLRTGFNGALSRKLLAIVDEINEGGTNARWENAETLKSAITVEYRNINPKYGHQRVEFNACRWLIFSNNTTALPLNETDRRFNVVRNDAAPKSSEYYKALYQALENRDFIDVVAELLRTRDISRFNPGDRAEMNEAKRDLVAASRSEAEETLAQVVAVWPSDIISTSTLGALVTNQHEGRLTRAHQYSLERTGVRKYRSPVKVEATTIRVSILRNTPLWENADAEAIRTELAKSPQLPLVNPRGYLEGMMGI
jgi:primase-polymerase (primpol)-like protein